MEKAPVSIKLNVPKAEAEAMKKQIETGELDCVCGGREMRWGCSVHAD